MDFVDRTGHIFSLPSYDYYPIGYEYNQSPYIFYFDSIIGNKLSVDNYYIKPIRILTKVNNSDTFHIKIMLENSNKFYLIDSDIIENKLKDIDTINDFINLDELDIQSFRTLDYTEEIDLSNLSQSKFKGALVKESTFYIANVKYWKFNNSTTDYTDQPLGIGDLIDNGITHFIDIEGNQQNVSAFRNDRNIRFGIAQIGVLTKYIQLISYYKKVRYESVDDIAPGIPYEENGDYYLINTFYAVVKSDEEGIWENNILIQVNEEYCPITVSADIIDEREELIINGQNMGISLPKEITKAIYSSNYNSVVNDEEVYFRKLKEYLLNFMQLKGELGNYRSIINSLKWFEWGDKLSLSKLLKNDNRIQDQYIKDFFDILNDNIYSYQLFNETSLINLDLRLTEEGEQEKQNLNNFFWGEGKSLLHNRIADYTEVRYDEKEYPYYKGYFNFTFNDLALKLAALKYYYEKYFLPIHIKIHKAYLSQQVFANDIKFITKTSHGITATPFFTSTNIIINNDSNEDTSEANINNIIFNEDNYNIIYFNRYYKKDFNRMYSENNKLYVDELYNEFSNYTKDFVESDSNIYYEINDTCLRIPIKFVNNGYYSVNLILSRYIDKDNEDLVDKDGKSNLYQLFESSFKFIQTDSNKYQSLIIYPKLINENNSKLFDSVYWLNNKFRIDLLVNGNLYDFSFYAKVPDFVIEMGTIDYKYDNNFKQIKSMDNEHIEFNSFMYLPNIITVNNLDFCEEVVNLSHNLSDYINSKYVEKVKFINEKYLNIIHLIELTKYNESSNKYEDIKYEISGYDDIPEMTFDNLTLFANAAQNIDLYKNFFTEDGLYNFDESILTIDKENYDLYLMHDDKQWYIILISQQPLDYNIKASNFKFKNGSKEIKIGDYKLKYERSDKKLLINRFIYNPSNGVNHFNDTDIVVASLKNNDKLSFKLSSGSKWKISPMSLDMDNIKMVTSNTELAIISINDKYSKYEKGYYNISVEYSVDDIGENIYAKRVKFRID